MTSTSRGRTRGAVRGQHAVGPTRHPARRQRVRLLFTGGADTNLFQLRSLTRPTGHGLLCALRSACGGWGVRESLLRTTLELVRALSRLVAHPVVSRRAGAWLTIKIGLSVWVRGSSRWPCAAISTLELRSVRDYLDYDVAAHASRSPERSGAPVAASRGPRHHQLWRVLRRVPEHQYDLYILSDHGQAPCTPYRTSPGAALRAVDLRPVPAPNASRSARAPPDGLARGIGAAMGSDGALPALPQLSPTRTSCGPRAKKRTSRTNIRVITAGPNAFIYALGVTTPLDADALRHRFPGLAESLSRIPAWASCWPRGPATDPCFWHGKALPRPRVQLGPFAGLRSPRLFVQGITDLMTMPSAGDLVIMASMPPGPRSFILEWAPTPDHRAKSCTPSSCAPRR